LESLSRHFIVMRVAFFAALAAVASGLVLRSDNVEVVEGEYIVVFHNNVTDAMMDKHVSMLKDSKVMFRYNMPTFKGYSVECQYYNEMLAVSEQVEVNYVEHNGVVHALTQSPGQCAQSAQADSWGLPRVSNRQRTITGPVRSFSGEGAEIYIMDTGLRTSHETFAGRYSDERFDATNEGPGDAHGHGTHCAGTAMGEMFGLARGSTVFEVKVLNSRGSGTLAGVAAGINWAANRNGARKVGSLSLGGGFSQALNAAANAAVDAGMVIAAASGNNRGDACRTSPASAEKCIAVSATTNTDARASYSNFGTCVDIFAPGSDITSAWIQSDTATRTISGTSMSCPHVAGAAAAVWSSQPSMSNDDVKQHLLDNATPNVVTNPGTGSPNRMLFTC